MTIEPSYAHYRRGFYQAIIAADHWRSLGERFNLDTSENVRDCVKLAGQILAEAPDELVREIERANRIASQPRP